MRTLELFVVVAFGLAGACSPFSGEPRPDDAAGASDGAGGDAGAAADAATGGPARLVFLSRAALQPGPDIDVRARQLCNKEGKVKRPVSTFVPWLSTTKDAVSMLTPGAGWALANGTPVFADLASVTTPPLLHPIDTDAEGGTQNSSTKAWTGTRPDGRRKTNDLNLSCQDFSANSSSQRGSFGLPAESQDGDWTDKGEVACDDQLALICFEL